MNFPTTVNAPVCFMWLVYFPHYVIFRLRLALYVVLFVFLLLLCFLLSSSAFPTFTGVHAPCGSLPISIWFWNDIKYQSVFCKTSFSLWSNDLIQMELLNKINKTIYQFTVVISQYWPSADGYITISVYVLWYELILNRVLRLKLKME